METMYKIDAVHDILKRIIKFNLTLSEAWDLYEELIEWGYEEKNIKFEIIKR